MRKLLWKVTAGLAALFVVVQFVPYRVHNASIRDEPRWDSSRTREQAVRSCFDCHSNESHVAAFEQVAPLTWWITNHVTEGRRALNFSEWHRAAGEKADKAAHPLAEGEMPPSYYTWVGLHAESKLSAAELQALVDGLNATIAADPPTGG